MKDKDTFGKDDDMGTVDYSLETLLAEKGHFDGWLKLTGVDSGELHVFISIE